MTIFDATLFKDKPSTGTVMADINNVNANMIDVGDFSQVTNAGPIYMDAENFDDQKMVDSKKAIQHEHPGHRVGTYAVYPRRDYWSALTDKESARYHKWLDQNALRKAAGDRMDIIMPSLYTFYDDQAGWVAYAKANILESRKYNKEIMPFLWFEYHDSAVNPYTYIGDDYWRLQIQTCLELTDNCIVWGGWDLAGGTGKQTWDDNAPWYKVVQEFL